MPQPWQQAATRLMWAACALVLVGVVLAVGLLSPARAAWGTGSVLTDDSAGRKVSGFEPPQERSVTRRMLRPSLHVMALAELGRTQSCGWYQLQGCPGEQA